MPYGIWGAASIIKLIDKHVYPTSTDNNAMFVFDYTTVQPETGGALSSARMAMDLQEVAVSGSTSYVEISKSNMVNWHLSNKWGLGKLYMCCYNSTQGSGDSFRIYATRRRADTNARVYATPTGLTAPSMEILLSHYYFNDPGGSLEEGKSFQRIWVDAVEHNVDSPGDVYVYAGDDDAYGMYVFGPALGIMDTDPYQAHWKLQPYLEWDEDLEEMRGFLVHVFEPPMRLSGRGLTLRIVWNDLGREGVFKGWGGIYIPGPASRFGKWIVE
jgi:hypothetical protein